MRKYQRARECITQEQDFVNIIQRNRISKFLHTVLLSRRQRMAVRFNKVYTIKKMDLEREVSTSIATKQPFDEDLICELLEPETNDFDRRLVYEISGVKLREDEYADDTSQDGSDDDTGRDRTDSAVQRAQLNNSRIARYVPQKTYSRVQPLLEDGAD